MNKKFVLIDDDQDDADIFCEAISQISWVECIVIENGAAFFDELPKHQIDASDVIFLDINMPMVDGWECLRKLKKYVVYSNNVAGIKSMLNR